ncbi:MAG: transposase domain-containing protein, partial [Actinomycetia bacterium]|nr:transposase domain-containing protein [Actinomycetes bacterium]
MDALYHRRRGQQLLEGVLDPEGWVDAGAGRRWRPPHISSLSRARSRLGADPLHMLFDEVAGPVGTDDAAGVFYCGLRVVSMDGSTTDVPDTEENDEYFGRPTNATRAGAFPQVRWLAAAESGTGALIGATLGPYTVGEQTLGPRPAPGVGHRDAGARRPQLLVPHPGPRRAGERGAPAVAGLGVIQADPHRRARRRHLPGGAAPRAQDR